MGLRPTGPVLGWGTEHQLPGFDRMLRVRCLQRFRGARCPRIGLSPEGLAVTSNAVASSTEQTLLREGVRWDARRDELLGVDILAGRLYRARVSDDGGLRLVRDYRLPGTVDGLTIPNGLGWSDDGSTIYLVDSGPCVIHAFAFDAERGTIADGRVLVTVAEDVGGPDGMTVDADGDLWVAIYGGGRIQRYSPAGVRLEELFVPAEQSTSCAFAGPGLTRLYVTTATEGWSEERRRARVPLRHRRTGGRPAAPLCPDAAWWATVAP